MKRRTGVRRREAPSWFLLLVILLLIMVYSYELRYFCSFFNEVNKGLRQVPGVQDTIHQGHLSSYNSDEDYITKALSWIMLGSGGGRKCEPHHNIMYLKTHKCASSSLQNIIFRYAKNHKLNPNPKKRTQNHWNYWFTWQNKGTLFRQPGDAITVAVPSKGVYFGHPEKFNAEMLKILPLNGRINMFASHARLDAGEIRKVLQPNTLWITVIRNPFDLYVSLFSYYKMTFDLGYDSDTFYNDTKIDAMIKELEATFDLVLVADRLEESLVLLGHALCWPLSDLLVLDKNVRMNSNKKNFTEEEVRLIEETNYSDLRLYRHFTHKLDQLIQAYGRDRLAEEVATLKQEKERLGQYCVHQVLSGHDPGATVMEYSDMVYGFQLAHPENTTCMDLVWNSKHYFHYFKRVYRLLFDTRI